MAIANLSIIVSFELRCFISSLTVTAHCPDRSEVCKTDAERFSLSYLTNPLIMRH